MDGSFFSFPKVFQWKNYSEAYESGSYLKFLSNSVIVTGITMIFVILLSSMVAYAISRFRWRYGNVVMTIFLMGMMIPMQATLLPLMIIFKNAHILNTHLSLILPYIAFSTPIAVFILSGFMKSIPHEIEESAFIDGASVYRIFRTIILPVSVPPVMTVCILTFINIWNEYILAATFISSEKLKTLPFGVYTFVSQYSVNYGNIGAFLVMGALPVILIYFFLSNQITKGMVAGAVKG
jgi:raffinose/stachyose/melibiose transport system permease protein